MNQDVTVREVIDDTYVGVSPSDGVRETVELLLRDGAPVAVVLEGSEAVGVCSDRDVLAMLVEGEDPGSATVDDAMTASVPTIPPDRTLAEARDRMATRSANWLVVTAGGEPLGVLTEHDLLAGSTLGGTETASVADETAGQAAVVAETTAAGNDAETAQQDSFDDQGICEICGALTHDLSAFNGQLRCADCRDV